MVKKQVRAGGALMALVLALAAGFGGGARAAAPANTSATPSATTAAPAKPAATTPAVAQTPAAPAPAPAPATPAPFDAQAAQNALAQIESQIPIVSSDNRLAALASQAAAIQAAANQVVEAQTPALEAIAGKLQHYAFQRHQTAAERKAEAALTAQRNAIDAAIAPARAVATAAADAYSQIAERRRQSFSTRILAQSPSPLSPQFWSGLAGGVGDDLSRLGELTDNALGVAMDAKEPQAVLGLVLCLALDIILLWPARRLLRWLGRRFAPASVGVGRSAGALWGVLVDCGLPTLAATLVRLGLQWGGLLSPEADALAGAAVFAIAWSSAILALGRALATEPEKQRRLMNLSDDMVARVRLSLWAVAIVTGVGLLLTRLNYVVGASVSATIAANCVVSLAYAASAGLILVSFRPAPAPAAPGEAPPPTAEPPRSPAWTLISLTLGAAIVVTVGAVFAGYTTLAALVSNQIFWLSLIAGVAYLLLRFVDDLSEALFKPRGWATRTLTTLFGLRGTSIRQAGLLITAGTQILLAVLALTLALTPFGQSGQLLLSRASALGQTIHIGSATISPSAIITGVATFVLGLGLSHLAKNWMVRRYLPVTGWDSGLRNSVATGVGYLGFFIAFLAAFAASGLGVSQIALIASALSVGIGFGLQQVVQNFASGLILLIERPVKVGDWVAVDGVEGDIRRIRVRSTEIAIGDQSTVIVPNSDLITKQVQNKTLGDPRGQVVIKLPIGNAADALRAPALIAEAAKAHKDVIQGAAPVVQIDSVDTGGVVRLVCALAVSNPRDAYRVRSDLYFAILAAFEQAGISLVPYAGSAAPSPAPPPPSPSPAK